MNDNKNLLETLNRSQIYQDYERSFTEATGLPVSLHSAESWQLPHHGKRGENPFCALMAQRSRACAACLQVQQQLTDRATHEPQTVVCHFGLSDTAVPVRLGEQVVGFLKTVQVFRKKPTEAQFGRAVQLMAEWAIAVDKDKLRNAFFGTRVLSNKQHESVVKLLN